MEAADCEIPRALGLRGTYLCGAGAYIASACDAGACGAGACGAGACGTKGFKSNTTFVCLSSRTREGLKLNISIIRS